MTEHDPFLKELQQRADRAHQSVDRAGDAPPELWQRVRSKVKIEQEERPAMSTMSMPVSPATAPQKSLPQQSRGFSHYVNLAVTIALVIGVALAGWFTTMQVNQPPPANPRFAALGMQPEEAGNGVCDVEPLTVDEAVHILTDPMGSLIPEIEDPASEGYPAEWFGRRTVTVPDIYLYMTNISIIDVAGAEMIERDFVAAKPIVDEYLDCLMTGNMGQMWRLTDPVTVQYQLVQRLPVLSSEEEIRELLSAMLDCPAPYATSENPAPDPLQRRIIVNPDRSLTFYLGSSQFLGYSGFAISPVTYLDADGLVIMQADLRGNTLEDSGRKSSYSMNVIYGRSALNGEWYVFDFFFPTNVPGWD